MLCISLSPPYGTLIALLLKTIETRDWQTSYRGALAIHQTAAPGPKGTTEAALWDLCLSDPFRAPLLSAGYGNPARLPRGKIVAVVELRECMTTDDIVRCSPFELVGKGRSINYALTDQERAFGNYAPGRYGWLLSDVVALAEPVAVRGMPGLWRMDTLTEMAVKRQQIRAVRI